MWAKTVLLDINEVKFCCNIMHSFPNNFCANKLYPQELILTLLIENLERSKTSQKFKFCSIIPHLQHFYMWYNQSHDHCYLSLWFLKSAIRNALRLDPNKPTYMFPSESKLKTASFLTILYLLIVVFQENQWSYQYHQMS